MTALTAACRADYHPIPFQMGSRVRGLIQLTLRDHAAVGGVRRLKDGA